MVGFPLLGLRALFGLAEGFDVGLGFDSYYFLMNEPRLAMRLALARSEMWSLAATFEAGYAFFAERASREDRGARWFTGHRNINLSPAAVIAYQRPSFRAARLFLELRYSLGLDTEPFSADPLMGVPPPVVLGHNLGLKLGAELPLSARTCLAFTFGLEIHGRERDAPVMGNSTLGLVTSL